MQQEAADRVIKLTNKIKEATTLADAASVASESLVWQGKYDQGAEILAKIEEMEKNHAA